MSRHIQAALMAAGVLAAGFAAEPGRSRAPRQKTAPTTRQMRIAELRARARWGVLSSQSTRELLELEYSERISRGRLARRMRRRKYSHAEQLVRRGGKIPSPGKSAPLRLSGRWPRAVRTQLLREEGRPVSGRQWKKLKKATRRLERGQ